MEGNDSQIAPNDLESQLNQAGKVKITASKKYESHILKVLPLIYKENYYNAYTNARDGKAIFFVNENYQKLISTNTQYCPVYEHIELGSKLRVVVFPYLWNTQKYPQVYCYSFEILDD